MKILNVHSQCDHSSLSREPSPTRRRCGNLLAVPVVLPRNDKDPSTSLPRAVLAINEPNLKGQAFSSPEKTAALYGKIKTIADKHQLPVVGPHMALGSGADSSIQAFDPIDKKDVVYTFMVPFLKAFRHFAGQTEVSATACHTYGNIDELRWAVGLLHKEFNRPVWVTEFA